MKILMSIKPKFVKQIFEGIKLFELRKKIFRREVKTIIIYESSPTKKIVGEFIIDKINSDIDAIKNTPAKERRLDVTSLRIREVELAKNIKIEEVS